MASAWPQSLPVAQLRIARPSAQLERVVAFYAEGLGLSIIYSYADDQGYDGVIFGLPGRHYNLEITRRHGEAAIPRPPPDSLLVLYLPERQALEAIVARLGEMGYASTVPRNPYWAAQGVTIEDPDGWRVVLMNTPGFGPDVE
jgi:catechol 2,3-dioxygenase-like lactoylglutathione lyase family enzyme